MSSSIAKPSPKSVVEMFMTKIREQRKDFCGRTGAVVRLNVTLLVYKCPKTSLCTENGEVFFEKGKGYSNPYRHLKSCVAGGDEQHLLDLYCAAVQETLAAGTLQNARSSVFLKLYECEKAMYGYMRLIVLKNLPISFVNDKEIRNFTKYGSVFCIRTFKETLFKLVEIIERKIKDEMMKQKGASFSARVCIRFFEDVFHLFGVNVHEWVLCQLADSCSVNKCIADFMEICNKHKLNLEVRRMIDADARMQDTIESVHIKMKFLQEWPKNRALLRNIKDLCPVLNNHTRWSSIYQMLTSYKLIRNALIRVAESSESSLNMNRSPSNFRRLTLSLLSCRNKASRFLMHGIDELNDAIRSGGDDMSPPLYECNWVQRTLPQVL